MSENILKWNDNLITWNDSYIRPTIPTPPAPTYPTDGLLGRWTFENDDLTDSFSTFDGSPYGDSTFNYGATGFGSHRYCAPTGGDDYFIVDESLYNISSTNWSISYWAYVGGVNPKASYINVIMTKGGVWMNMISSHTDGGVRCEFGGSDTDLDTISVATWTHYVATFVTGTKKLNFYINNGSPTEYGIPSNIPGNSDDYHFHHFAGWGSFSAASSRISLIYFYNKVLNADEVSELYNSGDGV